MDYHVGTLVGIYKTHGWRGLVESPTGHVRLMPSRAILPSGTGEITFATSYLDFPRVITEGEEIAYVLDETKDGRLQAKVWRPVQW